MTVCCLVELAVCECPALPKPPTSLVVTDVTANSARLTWNSGNTDPVQSYVVQYRHKYSSDGLYDEIFDVATTEYTVLGLTAHTVYEFRVVAVNAIGRSLPSSPVDVTTGELGMYVLDDILPCLTASVLSYIVIRVLANCLVNLLALPANPQNMEFYFLADLYGCVRLMTQSCLTLTTLYRSKIPLRLINIKRVK